MLAWPDSCKTGRKPATLEWILTIGTFKLRITGLPATSPTAIFPQLFSNIKSNTFLASSCRWIASTCSPLGDETQERTHRVHK
jgi:hypothetical protein